MYILQHPSAYIIIYIIIHVYIYCHNTSILFCHIIMATIIVIQLAAYYKQCVRDIHLSTELKCV